MNYKTKKILDMFLEKELTLEEERSLLEICNNNSLKKEQLEDIFMLLENRELPAQVIKNSLSLLRKGLISFEEANKLMEIFRNEEVAGDNRQFKLILELIQDESLSYPRGLLLLIMAHSIDKEELDKITHRIKSKRISSKEALALLSIIKEKILTITEGEMLIERIKQKELSKTKNLIILQLIKEGDLSLNEAMDRLDSMQKAKTDYESLKNILHLLLKNSGDNKKFQEVIKILEEKSPKTEQSVHRPPMEKEGKDSIDRAHSMVQKNRYDIYKSISDLTTDIEKGMDKIEEHASILLLNSFQKKGIFPGSGESYEKQKLIEQLGVIDKHRRLFDSVLQILQEHSIVAIEGDLIKTTDRIKTIVEQKRIEQLESEKESLLSSYPDKNAHINLLNTGVPYIVEILTGHVSAVDLFFPAGRAIDAVAGFYNKNSFADYYNTLNAQFVEHYLEKAVEDGRQKLRILEIGAGTGGTSGFVLKRIDKFADKLEYYYTDISFSFLNHGKERFSAKYPFIEYALLNIESTPREKYEKLGKFDIIFAVNAVHATQDLRKSFKVIKDLLNPGGCLILNELSYVQNFLTLTFGLLDGWWLYKDELRLPNSPLLSPEGWQELYEEMGFDKIKLLGTPSRDKLEEQRQIVVAGRLKE